MKVAILLDSGPIGLVSNPTASENNTLCVEWLDALLAQENVDVFLPEICDYEVRRELIRAGKNKGVRRLDNFKSILTYLPLSTEAMLQAAHFWSTARRGGYPTAHDYALDGDVILAAQASLVGTDGYKVIVATTNVKHLSRFVDAKPWQEVSFMDEDK